MRLLAHISFLSREHFYFPTFFSLPPPSPDGRLTQRGIQKAIALTIYLKLAFRARTPPKKNFFFSLSTFLRDNEGEGEGKREKRRLHFVVRKKCQEKKVDISFFKKGLKGAYLRGETRYAPLPAERKRKRKKMSHFFQTGVRCKVTLPLLNGFWRCQHTTTTPLRRWKSLPSSSFPQCKIHSSFRGDKSGNWTSVEQLWRGEIIVQNRPPHVSPTRPFHLKMFSGSPFLRKKIRWCCWFANIAAAVAFFCGKTNDVFF